MSNWNGGGVPYNDSVTISSGNYDTHTIVNYAVTITGFTCGVTGGGATLYGNGSTLSLSDGATFGLGSAYTGSFGIDSSLVLSLAGSATFNMPVAGQGIEFMGNTLRGSGTLTVTGQGNLKFDTANSFSGNVVVSGGTLTLANAGSVGTLGNITLNDGATLAFAAGVTLAEGVALGSGNGTVNTGTYGVTLSGVVSGSGSLTKAGAGWLALAHSNTYSGGTTLNAGQTLVAGNDSALGTGTLTLNGAGLDTTGGNRTIDNAVLLNGNFSTADADSNGSRITLTGVDGPMDLGSSTRSMYINTPTTISGSITGGSGVGLTKYGSPTLTLSGSNSYSGDTTVSAGTLILANSSALQNSTLATDGIAFDSSVSGHCFTFGGLSGSGNIGLADNATTPNPVALSVGNNGASTTYSGVLSGSGSLSKVGTGTLTLSGTNTYSGGTSIDGGTLAISGDGNLGAVPSSPATNLTFDSGTGGTLLIGGSLTLSANRGVLLNAPGTFDTQSNSVTVAGNVSGTSGLTKAGSGTLILSGTNTYSGGTTVNAGTLRAGSATAFGSNSALVMGGGTADIAGYGVSVGSLAGSSGTVTNSGAAATLTIGGDNTSTSYAGVVTDGTNALALTKTGTGTQTLAGTNTYTGATTINGGTLAVAADTALGNGSSAVTVNGGTLDFTTGFTTSRSIVLGTGTPTIAVDGDTQTLTALSGSNLTKAGAGTLNVQALPSTISVTGGTLQLAAAGSNNSLVTLSSLALSGGSLDLTNHDLYIGGGATNLGGYLTSGGSKVTTSVTLPTDCKAAIALVSATDYQTVTGTTAFDGTNVSTGDLVGRFTYLGDANLDGIITTDDYVALDMGFLFGMRGWINGDFEQTGGAITAADFADIDYSFQHQSGSAADGEIALHTEWFGSDYTTALDALEGGDAPMLMARRAGMSFAEIAAAMSVYDSSMAFGAGGELEGSGAMSMGLMEPAPVPEPGTLVLLGLGVGAGLLKRRLRRG